MTKKTRYKYIYGPVSSWRLGTSLGIDPISRDKKICTFDCVYCQVGQTAVLSDKREVFVPTKKIIEEIQSLPPLKIDYITFSGRGEPTLAKNLGEIIRRIRDARRGKIAVITNASLVDRKDVQEDLAFADLVMLKLDACSEESFLRINRPVPSVKFNKSLQGMKKFRSGYKGKLALQIMFVEENKDCAPEIAGLAKDINTDEVQINTPLRPCRVRPLPKEELDSIKEYFKGMNVISVYEGTRKKVEPVSKDDTLKRRGKSCFTSA